MQNCYQSVKYILLTPIFSSRQTWSSSTSKSPPQLARRRGGEQVPGLLTWASMASSSPCSGKMTTLPSYLPYNRPAVLSISPNSLLACLVWSAPVHVVRRWFQLNGTHMDEMEEACALNFFCFCYNTYISCQVPTLLSPVIMCLLHLHWVLVKLLGFSPWAFMASSRPYCIGNTTTLPSHVACLLQCFRFPLS